MSPSDPAEAAIPSAKHARRRARPGRLRRLWRTVWFRKLVAAGVILVFVAITVGWIFLRYSRKYETVTWWDVANPARWSLIREKQGRALIDQARSKIRLGRYTESFFELRVGVQRYPRDLEARILLAAMHSKAQQPVQAGEVLRGGLPFTAEDARYARVLLEFLSQAGRSDEVLETADRLRALRGVVPDVLTIAAVAEATVHFERRDYARLLAAVEAHRIGAIPWVMEMLAVVDWEAGRRDLAVSRLGELGRQRSDDSRLQTQLTEWLYTKGRKAELRAMLEARFLAGIDRPELQFAVLEDFLRYEDREAFREKASVFLEQNTTHTEALLALGTLAASVGEVTLVDRVNGTGRWFDTHRGRCFLAAIEARVRAGQLDEARALSTRAGLEQEPWFPSIRVPLDGLAAVLAFSLGNHEAYTLHLTRYEAAPHRQAEPLVAVADLLASSGDHAGSLRLIRLANVVSPGNRLAQTREIELGLRSADGDTIARYARTALRIPRVSLTLLSSLQACLLSDVCTFTEDRAEIAAALAAALDARRHTGLRNALPHSAPASKPLPSSQT